MLIHWEYQTPKESQAIQTHQEWNAELHLLHGFHLIVCEIALPNLINLNLELLYSNTPQGSIFRIGFWAREGLRRHALNNVCRLFLFISGS